MFQTKKILSERDLLSIIDVMLELTHEVYFTKEELEGIYFIDECRDEYFEDKMDIKEVKKAFKDFVWQKE